MSRQVEYDSVLSEVSPSRGHSGPWARKLAPALVLFLGWTGPGATAGGAEPQVNRASTGDRSAIDFFETSVRPVLVDSCIKCHGPDKQSSGLRLDSREAILKGGDSGPAVVPGKPGDSLLVQAVAHTHDELKMPPKKKLSDPAVAAIRRWVELGAPWGEPTAGKADADRARSHWAFEPVRHVA